MVKVGAMNIRFKDLDDLAMRLNTVMKFSKEEMNEWERKYNYGYGYRENPMVIANNSTGYSYDNTSFSTNAVLYWSEDDSCIYGIIYEKNQRGGGMGGERWYEVKVRFHEPIKSKANLKKFNKAKGKSVGSSSAGWTWKRKWKVPNMGGEMALNQIYEDANINPYRFLGISAPVIEWGIVNLNNL
jgi:hypothetical protein